jgi:methylmalonyl-CoA/ethylmalonyl-CoA epimerase
MPEPLFTETLQIALVVCDLDAAMSTYVHEYGIGPWEIYEFNPQTVSELARDERPSECAWRLALAKVGNLQWELIEPLDDQSIYADFLAAHGEGVQHVGVGVKNYEETLRAARAKRLTVLQSGVYKGVSFAYLSTEKDLGVITEIFSATPGQKQEPDAVYPAV